MLYKKIKLFFNKKFLYNVKVLFLDKRGYFCQMRCYSIFGNKKEKVIFYRKDVDLNIKIEIKRILNTYDGELYEQYIKKLLKFDFQNSNLSKDGKDINITYDFFGILRDDIFLKNIDKDLIEIIIAQIAQCVVTCYKSSYEDKEDYIFVPVTMLVKYIYMSLVDFFNINKTHEIIHYIIVLLWNNEKNIYKHYTKKKLNLEWKIKIFKKDVIFFDDNLHYDIYYKEPPQWRLDKNLIYNDINEKNIVRESNFYINNYLHKYTNSKYIEYINSAQNQYYKLDKVLFYEILKEYNIDSFIYTKNSHIHIEPKWVDRINIDEHINNIMKNQYSSYDSQFKKKKYDYLKKEIRKISLNVNYDSTIHINNIIILSYLTVINPKKKIYHMIHIDKRGRAIYDGLFNYVNSKIIRYLTKVPSFGKNKKIKNNFYKILNKTRDPNESGEKEVCKYYKFYISNQIQKNVSSFSESEDIYNNVYIKLDKKNLFKEKFNNIYNLYKVMKYGKKATISLDASSSAFQILSVITQNEKLMILTNAIKSDDSKKDIYDYLINILRIEYKSDIFYEYYINRKIVKNICMTYFYGSTPKYIAEAMIEKFKLTSILKIDLIRICSNIIKIFNREIPVVNKIKKLLYFYLDMLPEEFDINCKILDKKLRYNCVKRKEKSYTVSIKESLNFIANIFKKFYNNIKSISEYIDKNIYITIHNQIKELENNFRNNELINLNEIIKEINIWYQLEKNQLNQLNKIKYVDFFIKEINEMRIINNKLFKNKRKNVYLFEEYINEYSEETLSWITTKIESDNFCGQTKKRTTLVNIIHSIESQICFKTRYILKNFHHINTLSIHDCFLVQLRHYKQLLKTYNKTLLSFNMNIYNIIIDLKLENVDSFFEKVVAHTIRDEVKYKDKIVKILNSITKKDKGMYKKYYINKNIDLNLFKKDYNLYDFLIEHWITEKKKKYLLLLNDLKKEETFNEKEQIFSPFCLQPE